MHRHALEQLAGLIGARDAGARDLMERAAPTRLLAEPHRAGIGPIEAADQVERGGLAGAVRADDAGDRAGRASKRQIADRVHAAEAHREIAHRNSAPLAPGREKAADVAFAAAAAASRPSLEPARDHADEAHRAPAAAPPASARRRTAGGIAPSDDSSSGSSTTTQRADIGPSTRSAPPSMTTSRNRIDWKNGKRFRADEIADRGEDAAGNPGEHGRDARTPSVRISVGSSPIETAGGFPNRAPRAWPCPRGCRSAGVKRASDNAVSATDEKGDVALADIEPRTALGPGMPDRPFQPPVRSVPLGGALLDDEAEGDRHHGEIRPAHAQRRNSEQHAGQSGDDAAKRQARARTASRRRSSGCRPRRRRWRRTPRGRARSGR